MSSNFIKAPYLLTSRSFPADLDKISTEMSKSYIDIANAVNLRTIGIFTTTVSSITGETWFIVKNKKQQGIRQVYTFTAPIANIPHGLNFENIQAFSRCYGEYTDDINWYGLISGSNVAIAGQISFYLTPTNIVFLTGAGAPAVTRGNVVLEWLSNV